MLSLGSTIRTQINHRTPTIKIYLFSHTHTHTLVYYGQKKGGREKYGFNE